MSVATPDEIRDFDILEAIYDNTDNSYDDQYVLARAMFMAEFSNEEDGEIWTNAMMERGLLEENPHASMFEIALTPEGRAFVKDGISKRSDEVLYRDTVRRRLLRWSYDNSTADSHKKDVLLSPAESWFYGRVITMLDLCRAAKELEKHHLVKHKAIGTWDESLTTLMVGITVDGQSCVEEFECDIRAYNMSQRELSRMPMPTVNIGTMNGGALALGNHNRLSSSVGDHYASHIIHLGTAIREALPIFGLPPTVRAEAEGHLSELIRGDDTSKVRAALDWLKVALSSAATGALSDHFAGQVEEVVASLAD